MTRVVIIRGFVFIVLGHITCVGRLLVVVSRNRRFFFRVRGLRVGVTTRSIIGRGLLGLDCFVTRVFGYI